MKTLRIISIPLFLFACQSNRNEINSNQSDSLVKIEKTTEEKQLDSINLLYASFNRDILTIYDLNSISQEIQKENDENKIEKWRADRQFQKNRRIILKINGSSLEKVNASESMEGRKFVMLNFTGISGWYIFSPSKETINSLKEIQGKDENIFIQLCGFEKVSGWARFDLNIGTNATVAELVDADSILKNWKSMINNLEKK